MKLKLFSIILAVLFSFGNGTTNPEVHEITLYVNTSILDNSNIDEVCNFGQDPNIPNSEYTITVRPGDIVVWKGVSTSNEELDQVLIKAINHEGGARVFGRNTLNDTNQNPGIVIGTVTDGKDGDDEKYKLSFKVLNDGVKRNGTFHIDPKISVRN